MKVRLCFLFFILISLKSFSQPSTYNLSIVSSQSSICSGSYVTLTATVSDSKHAFNYSWSTGETTPSIRVNKAGTYTISVWDNAGDFQPLSKSITINTSAAPNPPVVKGQVICPNSTATLTATGPGGVYQWYDAPVGGKFLASGESFTTPPLIIGTVYYVEATLSGCTSPRIPVTVNVAGTPTATGATVCTGDAATLSAGGADSYTWYDAPVSGNQVGNGATFITPVLLKTTTYYVEATINGCTSRIPATAKVNAPPQVPKVSDITVCYGSSASLHADVPSGILNWFDVPAGGTSLISSPEFTTGPLTASTTYYVQTTLNDCQSARVPVHVKVTPIPETPAPVTICSGTNVTLTAATFPTGINQWYDSAVGGQLLATGLTFHTPILIHSTTYYVANSASGCPGSRLPFQIIVNPPPVPPSSAGQIICSGSFATLTATSADGGSIEWYDQATAGKLLSKNAVFTTPPLTADATYFIQTTQPGCSSTRVAVKVTVLPAVAAPTAASVTTCSGTSAVLKAFGKSGNYGWYDSPNNGKLLSSSQTFVTPQLNATTIYYVKTSENGCESGPTPVTVTVNPLPVAPLANGTRVCAGLSATLTANAPAGSNITWYDAAIDGGLLASGNTFTTPNLFETITYYVQYSTETCNSARTPVTVTVDPIPDIKFLYTSGSYLTSYPGLIAPVVRNGSDGTFSVQPEGLVFANTNTGEINARASKPGMYTVTRTSNNPCQVSYSSSITIYAPGGRLNFFYEGPYCQGGINPKPNSDLIPSSYSSSPGLVFVDTSTGEVNLSASTPGTYTVTRTINSNGTVQTCPITINEQVSVWAGDDQNSAIGQPIHLAGVIHGGSGGKWSGGAGLFSDPTLTDAIYTPASEERRVVLRLTTNDSNGCESKSDQMVITIQPSLIPPTAPDVIGCLGGRSTISATAPKGDIQWYDAPTGGNLLSVGPTFLTNPLSETTTYYAQATIGSIGSSRTAVKVTVNSPPAPSALGLTVLKGNTATLTATGSTGTYEWYTAPTGGDLLSLKDSYLTPSLTNNTSYYVQATVEGCSSLRTKVDILVAPLPQIIGPSVDNICSGSELNYAIIANVPTATFSWSRAAVAGISNPAVNDQKTSIIKETLTNPTNSPVNVTYLITIDGYAASAFNYVVTVYPKPNYIGKTTISIPNKTSSNFQIKFNTPGATFSWSRPAITGISNASISGQTASTISEVLFNTTNAPIDVTYLLQYSPNCAGPLITATVYPSVIITSANNGIACSGLPQNYTITSNITEATFSWKRDAIPNIANAAVTNQTTSTINETLINTGYSPVRVYYTITPIAYGYLHPAFIYSVVVNPRPHIPEANSNSPVCAGSTIQLRSPLVPGASYLWIGPNEYKSTLQNSDIQNVTLADAGAYKLFVTVNGCTSEAGIAQVVVNQPPLANAGPGQFVCVTTPAINLSGTVSGGTVTGVWNSSGNGTFFPSKYSLNAQYIPSEQDRSTGSVTLTLSSTSNDDCLISTSNMVVEFGKSLAVNAGQDIEVCSQSTTVPLAGKVLIASACKWVTSGSGTFFPAAANADASYMPSAEDIKTGTVKLTLMAIADDQCYITTDDLMVKFIPPPTINAGGVVYVLKDRSLTLKPFVSDPDVQYLWTPNIGISDNKVKNPVITGEADRAYTLKVTNSYGCISQDMVYVKVSPSLTIPNTFTPNADGINDIWEIKGLVAYQEATIDVFNRYGQKLFHSYGYSSPWDGTLNGQTLPSACYYYIIDTKINHQVLKGYVTIIK